MAYFPSASVFSPCNMLPRYIVDRSWQATDRTSPQPHVQYQESTSQSKVQALNVREKRLGGCKEN